MAYSFDPKDDVEAQWQKWSDSGKQKSFLMRNNAVQLQKLNQTFGFKKTLMIILNYNLN